MATLSLGSPPLSVSVVTASLVSNERKTKMNVSVTDNNMKTITYGYSPEHYASVVEFYSDLVQSGQIYTYTVKM